MNRSVGTHHWTVWWRIHRATARWTAGRASRCRSGLGDDRALSGGGAGAAPARPRSWRPASLSLRAGGNPSTGGLGTDPTPAPPWLMALLDRVAAIRITSQLLQRGRGRQVTLGVFPPLRLPARGPLAQQPAHLALPVAGHPPTPHRHKVLAPPPFGPMAPANGVPLPAGHRSQQVIGPLHRACRLPLRTHPEGRDRSAMRRALIEALQS
jgi:hypothetical protein